MIIFLTIHRANDSLKIEKFSHISLAYDVDINGLTQINMIVGGYHMVHLFDMSLHHHKIIGDYSVHILSLNQ